MKANELRIGNLVYKAIAWDSNGNAIMFSDDPYEVDSIDSLSVGLHDFPEFRGCCDEKINNIAPIPLTEEWLLKLGVKQLGVNRFEILDSGVILECSYDLQFVHDLQNLCFSQTKKELTIK